MRYIPIIIMMAAYFFGASIDAEEDKVVGWHSLDRQDTEYGKALYSGKYHEALPMLLELAETGDMIAEYYLGLVHDPAAHQIICRAPTRSPCRPGAFGARGKSYFNLKKAKAWYKKAIKSGHPYASYRLFNLLEFDHKPVQKRDRIVALELLKPYVRQGDGIARLMSYDIERKLTVGPHVAQWVIDDNKEKFRISIASLEPEAREGRVLSMHFLGVIYLRMLNYPKAFAWFTVGAENRYWPSFPHQHEVAGYFKDRQQEKMAVEALTVVKDLLEKQ